MMQGGGVYYGGPWGSARGETQAQGCPQQPSKGGRRRDSRPGLAHLPGWLQAVPLGDWPPGLGQHVCPVLGVQQHLATGWGRSCGPRAQTASTRSTLWVEAGRGVGGRGERQWSVWP